MTERDDRTYVVKTAAGTSASLEPGTEVRIGRNAANDLQLKAEGVEPEHALLAWPEGRRPTVTDLGTRCGTFLNGIRIFGKARLPLDSCTVFVGGVELQVLFANREALLTGISDKVSLFSDSGPELKGAVASQEALKDVMRELETSKRTGTLVLSRGEDPHSELTFYMGKVMGADMGSAEGLAALKGILGTCAGLDYELRKEFEPKDQKLGFWPSDLFRANA